MICVLYELSLSSIPNSFIRALNITTENYYNALLMTYFLLESVVLKTTSFSAIFFTMYYYYDLLQRMLFKTISKAY